MNYSVIRSGNKQYVVEEGDIINVELLKSSDKNITLDTLLRVNDESVEFGEPTIEKGVQAEIIEDMVKGEKKQGVKYKPGGYRRKFGHRQKYTQVKITKI